MPLQAADLSFSYTPARPVLRGLSFTLEPGSLCALIGPNGAGKSTLLRLLLGILKPSPGLVTLSGRPVFAMPYRDRARLLAYIPQRTSLAFAFTVREFVRLGRYAVSGREDERAVTAALERAGLQDRADDPLGTLSAGQQQRAAVARALAQLDSPAPPDAPRYLLADEPVSAMDPRHALEAMDLLRSLANGGLGVAVVLHDLTLAARFCDRALVLDQHGQLAAAGPAPVALSPAVLDPVFAVRFRAVGDPAGPGGVALIPSLPPGH